MEKPNPCDFCEEVAYTTFKIGIVTQHCCPTLQSHMQICDSCLQENGIDADLLAALIFPQFHQGTT